MFNSLHGEQCNVIFTDEIQALSLMSSAKKEAMITFSSTHFLCPKKQGARSNVIYEAEFHVINVGTCSPTFGSKQRSYLIFIYINYPLFKGK